MAEDYTIQVVEYGRTVDQPVGVALYGAYNVGIDSMPYGFVLARNADRVVLVDAGFEAVGSGDWMRVKFHVDPYVSPVAMLRSAGVEPEQVTDVIVTHAHYDHMGSLGSFPHARYYLQRQELEKWKWALGLGPRFSAITAACNPDDVAAAERLVAEGRMRLLDGAVSELLPGISVDVAPNAHSYMLQFAIFETRSFGRFIAAGDGAFSRRNFTGMNNDGAFVPQGFGVGSQTDMVLALEKLERLVGGEIERIIIVHEPETYAGPSVRVVNGMRIAEVCRTDAG